MTLRLPDPQSASRWCEAERARGASLGFVPTMGALHEGHLTLVRRAKSECERVVVSVFVNPLQFNDPRDFERYPRDFEHDARLLDTAHCDMVFTGGLDAFFPDAEGRRERIVARDPGPAALGLEGAFRPGHFAGVATIVRRLFEVVHPTRAYFGEKDFQQTLVVKHVARELGYPEIVVAPTSREPSGLARSSRNELLAAADRERAKALHAALLTARHAWRDERIRDASKLSRRMITALERDGIDVEYAQVRDPERWSEAEPTHELARAVALIAARVGGVRLIDNLRLDREDGAA